ADILLRSEGTQAADGDLRIVLDGCGFGLRQGERRAGRRGLCRGWGVPWVRGRLRFGEAAGDREQQRNATGWTNHGRTARASSLDRKSTRLNSSHLVISYAVFCLKKKNHSVYTNSQ